MDTLDTVVIKIPLVRERQQFQACAVLLQGEPAVCKLQLDQLHPKERAVYEQYQYARRKESYLLGRLSAKRAVLELTGNRNPKSIWIDSGVFQFPVVRGLNRQNIQVSISHCDKIGFSIAYPEQHPMGIDVERIRSDKTDIILSQLTANEKNLLEAKSQANIACYTALFSIKEALSKILKTGMMLDFKFLEINETTIEQHTLACTFTHFGQYRAVAFLKKNYVFSIVLPKRTKANFDKLIT